MNASRFTRKDKPTDGGKLRIGDDWNAIRIIALSQSNPLKAIAEFVENSIDAHAKIVTITRGREGGAHYLSIKDDGDGVPRDDEGLPKTRALQLRYLVRLYVKELVLKNFAGMSAEQLLERMVELSLYAEEKLKTAN